MGELAFEALKAVAYEVVAFGTPDEHVVCRGCRSAWKGDRNERHDEECIVNAAFEEAWQERRTENAKRAAPNAFMTAEREEDLLFVEAAFGALRERLVTSWTTYGFPNERVGKPDGTGEPDDASHRDAYQASYKREPDAKRTWRSILMSEVFETMAEPAGLALVEELLDVAGVAVSWRISLLRRLRQTWRRG